MMRTVWLAAALAVVVAAAWLWLPGFGTLYNLLGMASDAAPLAVMVCAMALCLRPGASDLSAEGAAALGGLVAAMTVTTIGAPPATAVGVAAGAVSGGFTGAAVGRLAWPVWLTTLLALIVIRLAAHALSGGSAVAASDPTLDLIGHGRFLKVPLPAWIAFGVLIATGLMGWRMRRMAAPPAPDRQTDSAPSPVRSFAVVGAVSAFAGIIVAARSGAAQPMAGLGVSLDALCALALAGHLRGVRRVLWLDMVLGIGIVSVMTNGIAVAAWPPALRYAAHALILVLATRRAVRDTTTQEIRGAQ